MDVREKLVELLNEVQETGVNEIPAGFGCTREYVKNEMVASHLIANGVTVREWISVTEMLPENICPVLVALEGINTAFNGWYNDGKWWTVSAGTRPFTQKVTHWMPLPQPPKGE